MNWSDIDRNPSSRKLRQFAAIWIAVFGVLAALRYARGQSPAIVAAVAALGLLGLAWPRSLRPLFVGLTIVTFPIGWVVSRVLLAVAFFAVFTPVAILFRIIGRDALRLRRGTGGWLPKKQPADKARYLRQF